MLCPNCNTKFTKKGRQKFCKPACRIAFWIKNNPDSRKAILKKYFDSHREIQNQRTKLHYHKNKEYYKKYRQDRKENNNARTRAKYLMKKAGIPKKCFVCNTSKKRIDVHHIDFNPLNNALNNLVYLCSYHHGLSHSER